MALHHLSVGHQQTSGVFRSFHVPQCNVMGNQSVTNQLTHISIEALFKPRPHFFTPHRSSVAMEKHLLPKTFLNRLTWCACNGKKQNNI